MEIPAPHNCIGQFSLICHQNQTMGILIQSADGINPGGITHIVHNVIFFPFFRSTHNPAGLVHRQEHRLFFRGYLTGSVHDLVSRTDFIAHYSCSAVDGNIPFFYLTVCLSSGTDSRLTEIFINSDWF